MANETKWCIGCGVLKPLAEFGRETCNVDGLRFLCKTCVAIRQCGERPSGCGVLTDAGYNALLLTQGGACAICGKTPWEAGGRLTVSRDLTTGKAKGLLCAECNLGLGQFQNSVAVLASAILYLEASK